MIGLITILFANCKKYLDIPSDKRMVIISNLEDLQSLLDAFNQINFVDPGAGEASADNNFLTDAAWQSLGEYDRSMYIWSDRNVIVPYSVYSGNIWATCYNIIYRANTVLFHIARMEKTIENEDQYNNIKGQAHFLRAKSYLQMAWIWCLSYDSTSKNTDLGLPLRLTPDFNEPSTRSTLDETYSQIIDDFIMAVQLLPREAIHRIRPGKGAAFGYLSRCYLSMRKYTEAGLYADSCLQIHSELMDFNTDIPNPNANYPIPQLNAEVVYFARMATPSVLSYGSVDTILYNSYDEMDLRKKTFFRDVEGRKVFRGSYNQNAIPFTGLATDEMYLTLAECLVRRGDVQLALKSFNELMITRWDKDDFSTTITESPSEALELILKERRKELLYRDLRWMDIKRLNKENYNIILSRMVNDKVYTLAPNDPKFALAIPEDIISRSNIIQNPR